jgi:hypothetical protein
MISSFERAIVLRRLFFGGAGAGGGAEGGAASGTAVGAVVFGDGGGDFEDSSTKPRFDALCESKRELEK